jgi:NAD(P)-dependent dehydrogenase (short-subunit alcohol dehydrogenase family)
MTVQLTGKHIAVTGGFGILGRAVGTLLAERGARVALIDRAPGLAGVNTGAVLIGGADLGDAAGAAAALEQARAQLGGLDGLVNVAGGFTWETLAGGAIESWDRMYNTNLRTAVLCSQAALAHLPAGGRIVNVGAYAALKAGKGMGAYTAAKAGVARLTEALAEELKERDITVNAVLPSILDTPANRAEMGDADAHRWVAPAELAAVIAFLLSDEARAITGACLPVTGRV